MANGSSASFSKIICVDWGKAHAKRCAWVADVERRSVEPVPLPDHSLQSILAFAKTEGPTLIAIDAVLGVPAAYFERSRLEVPAWSGSSGFLSWLRSAPSLTSFATEARTPSEWHCERPFIAVPGGTGSLKAFWQRSGGPLLRVVDAKMGAKSVFIVSGIPGTVGSGSRALWQELGPLLGSEREFGVWPFDGNLGALVSRRVVLAEIYPRVCYGLALDQEVPARLRRLGKTKREVRERAVVELLEANWVRAHGVRIDALHEARDNEDAFDAMMSSSALLRCMLENYPLEESRFDHVHVEGGILGAASILHLPRRG